jgi:uncharacterized protein
MWRPRVFMAVVVASAALVADGDVGAAAGAEPPGPAVREGPAVATTIPDPSGSVDVLVESSEDERFPRQSGGPEVVSSPSVTTDLAYVEDYANAMIQFVDTQLWTPWFEQSGYAEPMTGIILLGGPNGRTSHSSKCGVVIEAATPNAYYCRADDVTGPNGTTYDGSMIIPLVGMQGMWTGIIWNRPTTRRAGDFAAATLINHEYGHAVADELVQQHRGAVARPNWKWAELLADCFSGVAAYGIWSRGYLDGGDIDEAIGALVALGSDEVAAPDHHGTGAEREQAFRIGLYGPAGNPGGGIPVNCIQAYWKTDPRFPIEPL